MVVEDMLVVRMGLWDGLWGLVVRRVQQHGMVGSSSLSCGQRRHDGLKRRFPRERLVDGKRKELVVVVVIKDLFQGQRQKNKFG